MGSHRFWKYIVSVSMKPKCGAREFALTVALKRPRVPLHDAEIIGDEVAEIADAGHATILQRPLYNMAKVLVSILGTMFGSWTPPIKIGRCAIMTTRYYGFQSSSLEYFRLTYLIQRCLHTPKYLHNPVKHFVYTRTLLPATRDITEGIWYITLRPIITPDRLEALRSTSIRLLVS